MRAKLTKHVCYGPWQPPKGQPDEVIVWCKHKTGLGVRFRPADADGDRGRSFVFGYTPKNKPGDPPVKRSSRVYTIGPVAHWPTLERITKEALRLRLMVLDYRDPLAEKQAAQEDAIEVKTILDLAKLEMTDFFKTTWEAPPAKAEKQYARTQRSYWHRWILPVIGKKAIHEVTTLDMNRIIANALADDEATNNTAYSIRARMNAVFNRAQEWKLIPEGVSWTNPVTHATVVPIVKKRQRIMTEDEYRRAIDAAESLFGNLAPSPRYGHSQLRQLDAYLLIAETGRRPIEIRSLEWPNIDLDSPMPCAYVPPERLKVNRHDKAIHDGQTIGLSPRAVELLRAAKQHAEMDGIQSDWVFPSPDPVVASGENGFISTMRDIWKRIRKIAGIPAEVKMYTNRHHFICRAADKGVPLSRIAAAVGHSNIRTTADVYHRVNGSAKAVSATAAEVSEHLQTSGAEGATSKTTKKRATGRTKTKAAGKVKATNKPKRTKTVKKTKKKAA